MTQGPHLGWSGMATLPAQSWGHPQTPGECFWGVGRCSLVRAPSDHPCAMFPALGASQNPGWACGRLGASRGCGGATEGEGQLRGLIY